MGNRLQIAGWQEAGKEEDGKAWLPPSSRLIYYTRRKEKEEKKIQIRTYAFQIEESCIYLYSQKEGV